MSAFQKITRAAIVLAIAVTASNGNSSAKEIRPIEPQEKRLRVLITNDNGIDDPKIIALARAFSHDAEVWVVAPARDQSGTGAKMTFIETGKLAADRREIGEGIQAWAVDGTPGDCVVFAGAVLMSENPPDLVVSGINGGPNLGMEWLYSGTIGAARVAALGGIPAVAVSGLDDDIPGAVDAAVDWVVRFASSDVVKNLNAGDYVTVSLPSVEPSEVRGIKIVDRAPGLPRPRFAQIENSTWRLVGMDAPTVAIPENSDRAVCEEGFIAVIPMRLDEVNRQQIEDWQRQNVRLPQWQAD